MKILVLLKEVPVVSEIKIDREKLTIDRSGVGKMMNPKRCRQDDESVGSSCDRSGIGAG